METALQIVLQWEYDFALFRLHPIVLLGSHAGPTNQPVEPICLICVAEILILSAPDNSNETHTFMCVVRAGRFGQH